MKRHLSLLLAAMLVLLTACGGPTEPVTLRIIHTNDTHSQIDPLTGPDGKAKGGVVERASLLEYWRAQDPDLLYFDGGDMIQGSPYFNVYDGIVEIKAMNLQGLVATTFGNHEFDNGMAGLDSMLSCAQFPVVSCNYDVAGTCLEPYVKRYIIIERKGVKIGVTGATVDPHDLISAKNTVGVTYLDPVAEVNRAAAELRAQGCDLVILLSHLGVVAEKNEVCDPYLAERIRGVDVIVSAHTHRNIEHGLYVNDLDGKPVLITQTGAKAEPIGYIELTMVPAKGPHGQRYRLATDSTKCSKLHPEDYDLTGLGRDMEDFIRPWRDSLDVIMSERVGYSPETMGRRRPQSLLSNFTADAMMEIGARLWGEPMDISFMNFGGLRNDLPQGEVTLGDIFRIYPFENALCILLIKGSDLRDVIHSISGHGLEAIPGTCQTELVTIDGRTQERYFLIDGQPIDTTRTYRLVTIDYLAEGNGGFSALRRAELHETGVTLRDAMIDYVRQLTRQGRPVTSRIDGRLIDHSKKGADGDGAGN